MAGLGARRRLLIATPSEALRDNAVAMLESSGCEVADADSASRARTWLRVHRADLVLVDLADGQGAAASMADLLTELGSSGLGSGARTLALARAHTSEHFRRLFEERRVTNFVAVGANESLDPVELLVTVDKILSSDFFGVRRYLGAQPTIDELRLRTSSEKEPAVERAEAFARAAGCHPRMAQQVAIAVDELVTNAMYNAPVDAAGKALYAHLHRSVAVTLDRDIEVQFGSDGKYLCVATKDPYGSLAPERVLEYLARCFAPEGATLSEQSGGAGLGLFYLFKLLHSFVINLAPGQATECIGLFEISRSFKAYAQRGRSFNLFVAADR